MIITKVTDLLIEVGKDYEDRGVAKLEALHQDVNVNAFYRLSSDPSKVVHVQGYALSSESEASVCARLINHDEMIKLLRSNKMMEPFLFEYEERFGVFRNFASGLSVPYDAKTLEAKLEENVPQLASKIKIVK